MKKLLIYAFAFSMMIVGTAWALESGDGKILTGKHHNLNLGLLAKPLYCHHERSEGSTSGTKNEILYHAKNDKHISRIGGAAENKIILEADFEA